MQEIQPGDFVKIVGQESIGQVITVKGNDLEIAVGPMKMRVKKNKVMPAPAPYEIERNQEDASYRNSSGIDVKEKMMNFKFELDVRGKMKDEVITELSSWTDDAILLGIKEAKILHGRGTGVIKDTVRAFLKKYKEIAHVGDGQHHGGEGVTVVQFKE